MPLISTWPSSERGVNVVPDIRQNAGEAPGASTQSFGALLKQYRIRVGMSQERLAEHARLSVETISALERGSRRNPYRDTVALLTAALTLSPAEGTLLQQTAGRSAVGRGPTPVHALSRPCDKSPRSPVRRSTLFASRETIVTSVAATISTNRLVTLTGPGGAGKTRLASQIAAVLSTDLADGAWFVELASITEFERLAPAIAGALGYCLPGNPHTSSALSALLSQKHLLLVLDSCEHLIAAVAALATMLLHECPQIMLLVTSRLPLDIAGEATFRIPVLSPANYRSDQLTVGPANEAD